MPHTLVIPGAWEDEDSRDKWLADNCIKMARISVDQIKVPMEPTFWQEGSDSEAMKQLSAQIEAAFDSVLEVVIAKKPAQDMVTFVVMPVITFHESRDNPFTGLITISSRCGFWKPPEPAVN